uniref:RNase H type-1 domain-containing protein n=1 Tax=Arundo donax TaxID=35708 RepID=A0A0A9AQW2_ARUDO
MGRIILETDALNVKTALESIEFDLATTGVLFREARYLLLTNFIEFHVIHRYRSCNRVANELAGV